MTSYELTRCVVCDSSNTAEIANADDLTAEAELLWDFHMRRLSPHTPPERLADRVAFSQPRPWRIVRCAECGLVYRNPVERRQELEQAYVRDAPTRETMIALHEVQRHSYASQLARLRRVLGRRGDGLEVGSYVGAFLAAARADRWNFEGLDVNAQANALVRSLGFVGHDGDIEHFRRDAGFDAVVIWNTFDQLPNPRNAVLAAARLLRDGGTLAIRVPNGACYAEWRSRLSAPAPIRGFAARLLAYNNLLTFPYRFGFTPESLARLLRESGFTIELIVRDVLVPTADEWTRRWAALEERAFKPLTQLWSPWFEVYARK